MTENEFNDKLDLLIPGDIPLDCSLNIETAKKLSKVLRIFLQALQEGSIDKGLQGVNLALDNLDETETALVDVTNTNTSLKSREVQDYDRYFKINRIQTNDPEIALVKGLLLNTKTFFLLCQKSGDRLNRQQIEMQKRGFISYARLLARNFKLDIPDI